MKEIGYGREIIDHEYHAAMETIRDEIREYEEKYGDEALKSITYEAVIKDLAGNVLVEDNIDKYFNELKRKKNWKERNGISCLKEENLLKGNEPQTFRLNNY